MPDIGIIQRALPLISETALYIIEKKLVEIIIRPRLKLRGNIEKKENNVERKPIDAIRNAYRFRIECVFLSTENLMLSLMTMPLKSEILFFFILTSL
jgi:hypothetical protein